MGSSPRKFYIFISEFFDVFRSFPGMEVQFSALKVVVKCYFYGHITASFDELNVGWKATIFFIEFYCVLDILKNISVFTK